MMGGVQYEEGMEALMIQNIHIIACIAVGHMYWFMM